ncbi:MAG: hypothetical protein GY941_00095 [Planctomycetes bacterium]|nr:hypothetical protein [Planctomycetota bacterium]
MILFLCSVDITFAEDLLLDDPLPEETENVLADEKQKKEKECEANADYAEVIATFRDEGYIC